MLNASFMLLLFGPILLGTLALFASGGKARNMLVVINAAVLIISAGILVANRHAAALPEFPHWLAVVGELGIIAAVLLIAKQTRRPAIIGLGIIQACLAIGGEFFSEPSGPVPPAFIVDTLSLLMVLIVSFVGSLITVYAIGYMERHEHHGPDSQAGHGRFFFFLIGFLGAMNGLVLANDLRWLSIFWEITTVCSYMLIGHDNTSDSRISAERAFLINLAGGTALMIGQTIFIQAGNHAALSTMVAGRALLPAAFLLFAAITKAALLPFQSWLLGAMVAPTPVSALLHSSTMVKAGVYLVLRLTPGLIGTKLATIVAIIGAFAFMTANLIAIGQSNGKKILAYSTIANLGLIVACAAINSPLAYAAAIMLLFFHAVAKALLFICMGTIEQAIGSRDIEDQSGLAHKMPLTTLALVIGMGSMLLPPFGVLIAKWLAMEASVNLPLVMLLVVGGNACAVVVWCKWLGRVMTHSSHPHYDIEQLPLSMSLPQLVLSMMTLSSALGAIPAFTRVAEPLAAKVFHLMPQSEVDIRLLGMVKDFMTWPLLSLLMIIGIGVYLTTRAFDTRHLRKPFLCGENIEGSRLSYEFRGPMEVKTLAMTRGYYLRGTLGEENLTDLVNPIALALLITLFGVIGG